jgi:hypothetical protein
MRFSRLACSGLEKVPSTNIRGRLQLALQTCRRHEHYNTFAVSPLDMEARAFRSHTIAPVGNLGERLRQTFISREQSNLVTYQVLGSHGVPYTIGVQRIILQR